MTKLVGADYGQKGQTGTIRFEEKERKRNKWE